MKKVEIKAGICGFTTMVQAEQTTSFNCKLTINSECPNWQKVNDILDGKELNAMQELFKDKETGTLQSEIFDIFFKTIPHVSCPVLSGSLKALEVSTGLALEGDATITFIK